MEPVRTCVGCRHRANRSDLIRIVNNANQGSPRLVVDSKRSMAGRGAWLHAAEECLKLAIERRAFGRALKLTANPDATGLNFSKEQAETMLASNE